MRISLVKGADVPEISQLYCETVHRVNVRDDAPAQIAAWAPRVYPDSFWPRRFGRYRVFVAEDQGRVVGFAELAPDSAVDCFYVHHAHQGKGVGAGAAPACSRT